MKKIFLLILLTAIVGGGCYLWENRERIFFQGQLKTVNKTSDGNTEVDLIQQDIANGTAQDAADKEKDNLNNENSNQSYSVQEGDCEQKCRNKKGTDSYNYCREICGLNEPPNLAEESSGEKEEDCEKITDSFERGVCYKRKAIREKKDTYCDKIEDSQLKESCVNRVVEEIL